LGDALLVRDEEAARLLSVSRSTFHVLVAGGQITRLKIGRAAGYRRSDITAFIERLAGEAPPSMSDASGAALQRDVELE
jgi:excisionase family DNA binding protein